MSGIIGVSPDMRSSLVGPMTPNQPGFAAVAATSQTMATSWQAVSFTQRWDQGECYDGTTFTAPVTGKYFFSARIHVLNINSGDECYFRINTSNTTYYTQHSRHVLSARNDSVATIAIIADMDTNDTMVAETYNASGARGTLATNENTGCQGWLLG